MPRRKHRKKERKKERKEGRKEAYPWNRRDSKGGYVMSVREIDFFFDIQGMTKEIEHKRK